MLSDAHLRARPQLDAPHVLLSITERHFIKACDLRAQTTLGR